MPVGNVSVYWRIIPDVPYKTRSLTTSQNQTDAANIRTQVTDLLGDTILNTEVGVQNWYVAVDPSKKISVNAALVAKYGVGGVTYFPPAAFKIRADVSAAMTGVYSHHNLSYSPLILFMIHLTSSSS
jgi:hypothetical protein